MDLLTYKGFIQNLKEYGFEVSCHHSEMDVEVQDLGAVMGGTIIVARVSTTEEYAFECHNIDETLIKADEWRYLASQCLRLAATPIKERGNYKTWLNEIIGWFKKNKE